MAIGVVADEGSVFVEKEVSENVYVPEQSASSAIETLSDGLELVEARNLIERSNRTSTVERVAARTGTKEVSGSIPTEFKAGLNEGEPETAALYEAALGGKAVLSASTSVGVGINTVDKVYIDAGDISKYKKHYIVKIKQGAILGEDHISPIKSVGNDVNGDYIELLVPAASAFSDGVEVSACTQFFHASGAPTLSITNYLGGVQRQKAIGARPTSIEMAEFATGSIPTMTFGFEGLDYARELGSPLFAPEYDGELGVEPPVALCAKVYKDNAEIQVNNVSISMANTLGFLTSTANCNGRISSRITAFTCDFSINPYLDDASIEFFNAFDQNTEFSIFGYAFNYQGTNESIKDQAVAYYMPTCRIPELSVGDEDGILTEEISGAAYKNEGGDTIFIAFM